jgi:hypothetical protein
MNTPARLAGFAVILTAALGAGYGAGAAVGPLGTSTSATTRTATEASDMNEHSITQTAPTSAVHGGHAAAATPGQATPGDAGTDPLGGLAATDGGYTVVARSETVAPGPGQPFTFMITGPDGAPVTAYIEEHTKELHLVAVRRDGGGYQHTHPTRDATGQWHAVLDLSPGPWRLIADAVPARTPTKLALGMDVRVTGDYTPVAPTEPSSTVTVGDFTVSLAGAPAAGAPTELGFTIDRAGAPVTPEPYLGSRGHLVAVRETDLGYLHVHPDTDALSFTATFPTPGRYWLFLDVSLDGQVRTAPVTVDVT